MEREQQLPEEAVEDIDDVEEPDPEARRGCGPAYPSIAPIPAITSAQTWWLPSAAAATLMKPPLLLCRMHCDDLGGSPSSSVVAGASEGS